MTQLDVVYVNFCADALENDRVDFLNTVENAFETRSPFAFSNLISLGVPCVNFEHSRKYNTIIYMSNNDILKWIRETALEYISHYKDIQRQFIEETSKIKEL